MTDKEPVFGASSFFFTVLASGLKLIPILNSDFMYARLPGLVGYMVILWLAFVFGRMGGGMLTGLMAVCYIACYPGYFVYSVSGLETLMAGAFLIGVYYLFYRETRSRLFYVLCAILVLIKLEYLIVATFLVACEALSLKKEGKEFRQWFVEPLCMYGVPCLCFFSFCWAYFGSPIPNSLTAKLVLDPSPDGYRYVRYLLMITRPTAFIILVSLPSIFLYVALSYARGKAPSLRFMGIAIASLILLAQLALAPFREIFHWYFLVPLLAFQFTVISSAIEVAKLVGGRLRSGLGLFYAAIMMLLIVALFTPLFPQLETFMQVLNYHRSVLLQVETERRDLASLAREKGSSRDVLLTGLGWTAYDSKMRVVDVTGINTPWMLTQRGKDRLHAAINKYDPDFLLINKVRSPVIMRRYELLAVGPNIRKFTSGGVADLELYRKRDREMPLRNIMFLGFDEAMNTSTLLAHGQAVRRISSSDYVLCPNKPGSPKYRLEYDGLSLGNAYLGTYCYVTGPVSFPVEFVMEAVLANGKTISNRVRVSHESGICLLSLVVSDADIQGKVIIYTESSHPESIASPHVRDFFIAQHP